MWFHSCHCMISPANTPTLHMHSLVTRWLKDENNISKISFITCSKGISKFRHVMLIPTNFQKCDCTSRFCPYIPQDHALRPVRSPFGWKALHHLKAPPNSPRIFMYRKIQHIVHLHCLFVLELFIYLHLSLTPYLVDWPIVGRLVSAPHASGSHPPIKICQ
jgi:hypothetical protein